MSRALKAAKRAASRGHPHGEHERCLHELRAAPNRRHTGLGRAIRWDVGVSRPLC